MQSGKGGVGSDEQGRGGSRRKDRLEEIGEECRHGSLDLHAALSSQLKLRAAWQERGRSGDWSCSAISSLKASNDGEASAGLVRVG